MVPDDRDIDAAGPKGDLKQIRKTRRSHSRIIALEGIYAPRKPVRRARVVQHRGKAISIWVIGDLRSSRVRQAPGRSKLVA